MSAPNVVMFGNLAKQIADTYEKKNTDYGNSFTDSVERYGYVAGIVRMADSSIVPKTSFSEIRKHLSKTRVLLTRCWTLQHIP